VSNSPFLENVVIITGASTGIGRQLALQLADQGAWLALTSRNAEKLEEVAMTWRGKLGLWLKLIAPGLVDRIVRKAIEEGR
jgi:short-subunit dehydrogenase